MKLLSLISWLAAGALAQQTVETVKVVAQPSERVRKLPGEFLPYQSVELTARVPGYLESITVDRGSVARQGQLIATLTAPEMDAQIAEARSKVAVIQAQRDEAEAKLVSAQGVYDRLKKAAETPGAISGNELEIAGKAADAARQVVRSHERAMVTAEASAKTIEAMKQYLRLEAPFDGVVTERMMHPGALAGPGAGPLVRLEQVGRLRLVVAVPETDLGGIVLGARVSFTVPAFPGQTFQGAVARLSRIVDPKTRTSPVELEVANPGAKLAPGMYPEVQWPVRKAGSALLVPPTAIATTTERSFVIRLEAGRARYISVKRGLAMGDLVEVQGALAAGDVLVRRATDELREGTPLRAK